MGIIVGLFVAAFFGSGDFLGGRASWDAPTPVVLFVAQVCAAIGALVLALVFTGDPIGADLAYGAAAGLSNAIGLGLLYQGLSMGAMGIVAPVAAVVGALIPVIWGLLSGEEPGSVVIVGVLVAVVAAGLISREAGGGSDVPVSRSIVIALFAGVGLGVSFVLYAQTGASSGLWPVLSARVVAVAVALVGTAVVARSEPIQLPSIPCRLAIAAGVCDVSVSAFLLYGIRHDLAVVIAPLAALGPGFTVMLAWAVLREPVSRLQAFGLVLALLGLALIAIG